MPRYALLIAYDGTAFHGWQGQPGLRTAAGVIDAAWTALGEPAARCVGASRMDAGVHARVQVAHVDCQRSWPPALIISALNHQLPNDLRVRNAAAVSDDWDAISSVMGKTYRYRLDVGAVACADPRRLQAWRPPLPLDLEGLNAAAAALPGTRDLGAFVRRGEQRDDLITTITACAWRRRGRWLDCRISATGFGYRLVRSLVGSMVVVGHSDGRELSAWQTLVNGAPPSPLSQHQAPACGLTLVAIRLRPPPRWRVTAVASSA